MWQLISPTVCRGMVTRGLINRPVCRLSIHSYQTTQFNYICPIASYRSYRGQCNYNHNFQTTRLIHSSSSLGDDDRSGKPSSKVEQTVKELEKQLETSKEGKVVVAKRPMWKRIQDEVLHYYHGFRLLLVDINISSGLVWRILNGKQLTRREYKQLIRTTSDVFRLVPFSVFIIVPFMEFLLPVFLKFFPGMLPSTFQSSKDRESKMKGELKVKLEMVKFLQQTLDEMAPQADGRSSQKAKDFSEFITKIRGAGEEASTEEIMKFSKLFEDEITLDSLSRQQLMALCRLLEIPAMGPSAMLLFQLRMRLRTLKADDKVIEKEGIDSLDLRELQTACKARGMRAFGVPEDRLKRQLQNWLQLSLHEQVPSSLLLLSRAMYLPENIPTPQKLQATMQALPNATTLQTKAAIGEREGKIDNKTRIELIKEEERKIKEERLEALRQEQLRKEKEQAKREIEESKARTQDARIAAATVAASTSLPPPIGIPEPLMRAVQERLNVGDVAPQTVVSVVNEVLIKRYPAVKTLDDGEVRITQEDMDEIESVISKMGKEKLLVEKEELRDLKEEMADYVQDVRELEDVTEKTRDLKIMVKQSKGAKRLLKRLNTMITKLDSTIDTSEDDKKTLVATSELLTAVRMAKDVKDPVKMERLAAVFAKLDDDLDGKIELDDLVKVIDLVGQEHVDLNYKQLEELVSMLTKEDLVEQENKDIELKLKAQEQLENPDFENQRISQSSSQSQVPKDVLEKTNKTQLHRNQDIKTFQSSVLILTCESNIPEIRRDVI